MEIRHIELSVTIELHFLLPKYVNLLLIFIHNSIKSDLMPKETFANRQVHDVI